MFVDKSLKSNMNDSMEVDTSDPDLPDMETVENVDDARESGDEQIGFDQGAQNIIYTQ